MNHFVVITLTSNSLLAQYKHNILFQFPNTRKDLNSVVSLLTVIQLNLQCQLINYVCIQLIKPMHKSHCIILIFYLNTIYHSEHIERNLNNSEKVISLFKVSPFTLLVIASKPNLCYLILKDSRQTESQILSNLLLNSWNLFRRIFFLLNVLKRQAGNDMERRNNNIYSRFLRSRQLVGCVPAFRLGIPPRYKANKL